MNGEGKKFDEGKPRMSLLPYQPLLEVVKVLEFGAKKYGDYNWRGGMDWMRLIDAALRHCFAWLSGENVDKESGLDHLAHAACNLLFLLQYKKDYPERDTRFKREEGNKMEYKPACKWKKKNENLWRGEIEKWL